MPKDPEQQTPEEQSHPVRLTSNPALPFNIDEYLPKHQRKRAWYTVGGPKATGYSAEIQVLSRLPPTRETFGARAWKVLMIAVSLLLIFGVVRLGVAQFQSSYPGDGQCYLIERWLYEVNSDLSRIEWVIADAEEEVSNDTEAKEADARITQMVADMRTSVARSQAPEELAELKALWLQVLDLILEISEANQNGDNESVKQLLRERDMAIVQREEEEDQVLRDCRLARTAAVQAGEVGNQASVLHRLRRRDSTSMSIR